MSDHGLIPVTALSRAERYAGQILEQPGSGRDHPLIQWWLSLCGFGLDVHDEVPWCSAFVNGIAWDLRLPRSKSAMARSWLDVGVSVAVLEAIPGFDVVILKRGAPPNGHVGFFAGRTSLPTSPASMMDGVRVLGGNQDNSISAKTFAQADVLGVRRLRPW